MGEGAAAMSEYERQNPGSPYGAPASTSSSSDAETPNGRTPEEIQADIERTRERMSRGIDALGERLNPQALKEQAQTAISDAAHGAVQNVRGKAREKGTRFVEMIRDNPIPAAALGVGVTWLLTRDRGGEVSGNRMKKYAYKGEERRTTRFGTVGEKLQGLKDRVGDAVGGATGSVSRRAGDIAEMGSEVRERASGLGEQARERGQRARSGLKHAIEENPLAVAAGAVVLGLAFGLLLPETERENRVMGSRRDELVDRAKETGQAVKEAATATAQQVKETVKAEAQDLAPGIKQQVKEKAGRVAQEAKEAAREEVSRRNL
jgi:gas vesicle protein